MDELNKITFLHAIFEMDVDGVPYIVDIPFASYGQVVQFKEKNTGKVIGQESAYIITEYEQHFGLGIAQLLLAVVLEAKEKKKK
jgi:hypothetical protein